jgi:hypothetical protein
MSMFRKPSILACLGLVATCVGPLAAAPAREPGNERNPKAVQEVLSGKRTEANAARWGFDEDDSTEALQAAIKSGAKRVVVPDMKQDRIVRPIQLAGDQELIFESGVVITAKRGSYRGGGDTVLNADNVDNLTIRGAGTVRSTPHASAQPADHLRRGDGR